jgi:hypothetical protein
MRVVRVCGCMWVGVCVHVGGCVCIHVCVCSKSSHLITNYIALIWAYISSVDSMATTPSRYKLILRVQLAYLYQQRWKIENQLHTAKK